MGNNQVRSRAYRDIYDPNIGSTVPTDKTKGKSVDLGKPTFSPFELTPDSTAFVPIPNSAINTYCSDDSECMNIDEFSSTPDNIVYSCPSAKCLNNQCSCGSSCKIDPYSGRCCQGLENIRGDTFCIENTAIPGLGQFKWKVKNQAFSNTHLKRPIRPVGPKGLVAKQ
jgi:hypothetical protein